MKKYKALFLDWDDTIGDFQNAAHQSLQDIYTQYGLDKLYDSFDQYYACYTPHNVWLWGEYGADRVTKDYLEFDRFFYPLMLAPRPLPMEEAAGLAQRMCKDHLRHTTDYFRPLPGAPEAVRRLAEKYPLVVVSNGFVEVQYKKIALSGLKDSFTDVVLSEEVGCQKPNPKIFEKALERNGWKPDEVLMIGDSWTSDIQGAIAAGIDQLWVHSDHQQWHDTEHPATYHAESLTQAADMLL